MMISISSIACFPMQIIRLLKISSKIIWSANQSTKINWFNLIVNLFQCDKEWEVNIKKAKVILKSPYPVKL